MSAAGKICFDRLPQPTTDLDQVKRDFTEFGYGLIKDCLSPDQVSQIRDRLLDQAAAERSAGKANLADGGKIYYGRPKNGDTASFQLVRALPNKGEVFRDLILQPKVLEVMKHGFGELDFCMSNLTGMVTRKDAVAQVLHCDQSYLPDPQPRAWVNNVLYMITEFTDANGGTRVVPKTQHNPPPKIEYFRDGRIVSYENVETMPIEGPPGTAFVFDGRLWHGAGPSRVPGPRLAISGYYMIPQLRQSENYPACIHDDAYAKMTVEQRAMLGFKRALTLNYIEPMLEGGRTNTDTFAEFTPEMHL